MRDECRLEATAVAGNRVTNLVGDAHHGSGLRSRRSAPQPNPRRAASSAIRRAGNRPRARRPHRSCRRRPRRRGEVEPRVLGHGDAAARTMITPVGAVRYAPPSTPTRPLWQRARPATEHRAAPEPYGPMRPISVHAATSTEMRAPCSRAARRESAVSAIGSRNRVPEDGGRRTRAMPVELSGLKSAHPAIRSHRALSVGNDHRHDHARRALSDRSDELTLRAATPARQASGRVISAFREDTRRRAERRGPRRDVRGLAAGTCASPRAHVVAGSKRLVEPHDHVEHHISESDEAHSTNRPTDERSAATAPRRLIPWTATTSGLVCVPSSSAAWSAPRRRSRRPAGGVTSPSGAATAGSFPRGRGLSRRRASRSCSTRSKRPTELVKTVGTRTAQPGAVQFPVAITVLTTITRASRQRVSCSSRVRGHW